MAISLHHAQVFYPPGEEARARRFYTEALGLGEIERPSTLRDHAGLWFSAPPGHVHLSLRVGDLAAAVRALKESGARFEEADPIPGWRRTYVFDPFGNKIELDEIRD